MNMSQLRGLQNLCFQSLYVTALVIAFITTPALVAPAFAAKTELRVVATIKPVHALVAGVMAGVGDPHLIVKGAASPHTYAMKPSDAAALQQAQVVFRVGGAFERFLDAAIKNGNASATVVSLGDAPGVRRLPYRTGKAWGGASHDHHDHDHAAPSKDSFDPHLWLDPDNAIEMVAEIERRLTLQAPARRAEFARNAAEMVTRIKDLQSEALEALAPVRGRPFLVFHDAFQYFEKAFAVTAVGAVSLGDSRAPGARRIKAIRREIASRNVVCVFAEPQFAPKIIATLVAGTSVRRGTLDPIGAGIEAGPDAYFELIRGNTKSLVDCLR